MDPTDNSGTQPESSATSRICFDIYEIDVKMAELRKDGTRITLHEQSFQILLALLRAHGKLVTKTDLQKILWPLGTDVDVDRSINKAIAKLRAVLDDSSGNAKFIETIRDQGYRFLVPVRFLEKEESACAQPANTKSADSANATPSTLSCSRIAAFGPFEFDLGMLELRKRGARVRLHAQPLSLLVLLLERQGQVVSKEELQQQLWPSGTYVDFETSLRKAVSYLRIALEDSAEKPAFVETLPGRGYRFIATVHYLNNDGSGTRIKSNHAIVAAIDQQSEHSATPPVQPTIKYGTGFLTAAIIFVLGCVIVFYLYRRVSMHPATARPSIAILEFRNLSGQPDEAWLTTALAEWITAELSSTEKLRIISGEQVAQMQMEIPALQTAPPTPNNLLQIRRILGTDFVVSGSYGVRGADDNRKIQVDLQLQDARTGKVLKSISETANKSDLFALISHAGESLRSRLGVPNATQEEVQQSAAELPSNAVAMRLYSGGLHKLRIGDALAARDLLQKAALAQPDDANIHDRLATAWAALGYDFKAIEESKMALGLSTKLPREEHLLIEAHSEAFTTNWDRAIQIYRTLFDFFPDNPEYGLSLSDAQVNAGKPKDALTALEEIKRLASVRDDARIELAEVNALLAMGDAKQALAVSQRAEQKASDAGASLLVASAELGEGWAYIYLSSVDKSIKPLSDARNRFALAGIDGSVAEAIQIQSSAYIYAADFKKAESSHEEALTIFHRIGNQSGVGDNLLSIGDLRLVQGDPNGARSRFEEALSVFQEIHSNHGIAMAKHCLGRAYFRLGMPLEAQRMYEAGLDIFRQTDNRHWIAESLLYLAETSRYEGNFDAALKQLNEGSELDKKIDYKVVEGWNEVLRTQILLDQDHNGEAIGVAQNSIALLTDVKDAAGIEYGQAMLAQAYLQQGKLSEAKKNIREARETWNNGKDVDSGLAISLNEAMIQAASGNKNDVIEAEQKLRDLAIDASRIGYASVAFETRYELAKLELQHGEADVAKERLQALAKEAGSRGMGLISWKIQKLLHSRPS